jgi:hypothetical protein
MTRPQPEETDTRKFTSGAVRGLLQRNLKGDYNPPRDAGCHRLADAFNRIYEREIFGEVYDSPHMSWSAGVGNPPAGADIRARHGKRKVERRWSRFVRELAETIQTELAQANSGTPVGLSDDGPVARVTLAVIDAITGEKPTTASIVREVLRQQRKA